MAGIIKTLTITNKPIPGGHLLMTAGPVIPPKKTVAAAMANPVKLPTVKPKPLAASVALSGVTVTSTKTHVFLYIIAVIGVIAGAIAFWPKSRRW